jgi:hypothetical protein
MGILHSQLLASVGIILFLVLVFFLIIMGILHPQLLASVGICLFFFLVFF